MDCPSDNGSSKFPPLTKNFSTIVAMSRLFGCHSGSSSRSVKKFWKSNFEIFYSIVWVLTMTVVIGFACRLFDIRDDEKFERNALRVLTNTNVIMISLGHLISSFFAIVRAENFEIAITRVRNFDEATCTTNNCHFVENIVAGGLTISTWLCVFWIFRLDEENVSVLLVFRAISLCVLTLEIYKYFFVFAAVLRRFVRLNAVASTGKISVITANGIHHRPLTVQNVFIWNYWLTEAAENFNKYFDVQIVYWLVYFIIDLIVHAFMMAHDSQRSNIEPNRIARLAFSLYCPALICWISHFTCKRANELGKLLFSHGAPSLKTTASSLEIVEFGFYLYKKPLKITGLKLFTVDLPLLLSIIEAAATYVTFILQNAMKLYNKIAGNNETEVYSL